MTVSAINPSDQKQQQCNLALQDKGGFFLLFTEFDKKKKSPQQQERSGKQGPNFLVPQMSCKIDTACYHNTTTQIQNNSK